MKRKRSMKSSLCAGKALFAAAAVSLSMFGSSLALADTTDASGESAEISVYAEASAELITSSDLILYEGIDSYTAYGQDGEEFQYYDFEYIDFEDGDQIVVTLSDGSTLTYVYSTACDGFIDEDCLSTRYIVYMNYDVESNQYEEHWEVGGTYYFTMDIYDSDTVYITGLQIPVTIAESPDAQTDTDSSTDTGNGSDTGSSTDTGSTDSSDTGSKVTSGTSSAAPAAQTVTVKKRVTKKIKASKLKKKKVTFKIKASTNGDGKITFTKKSGDKALKISKNGKVTVKKGTTKKKTYKMKVTVKAAATSAYSEATKTITVKVKVK